MLGALWMALILLTVWAVPAARAETASEGDDSAYDESAPKPHPSLYQSTLPILGICYGIQRMTVDSGGEVARGPEREYGKKPGATIIKVGA